MEISKQILEEEKAELADLMNKVNKKLEYLESMNIAGAFTFSHKDADSENQEQKLGLHIRIKPVFLQFEIRTEK